MSRELIFRDDDGAEYQPVRHYNRQTGISAFRVKPPGASNETQDCIELESIEELAKAMLIDNLPARVKPLAGGPVNYLKFGAQKLVAYELDPKIAGRLEIPAVSGAKTSQADQIRQFIVDNYISPARERQEIAIELVSGEVHNAMGLRNALPAVCSVLEGKALAEQAKVTLIGRESPIGSDRPSSTIRYRFSLSGEAGIIIDRSALERLRQKFLEAHPDFVTFDNSPSFAATEGNYKRALVEEAGRLVAALANEGPEELGKALIDLLVGRGGLYSNLIDRWALKVIDKAFADYPGQLERAAGTLARADAADDAVAAFLEDVWLVMRADLPSNPFAESRMFPTMLRALVRPTEILPIRSTPTYNAMRALIGEPTFANAPLSREELARVNAMAREIMHVMEEEWGWRPRDMWDVQGFIWVTCQKKLDDDQPAENAKEKSVEPTNLILYGPPGTGKTYRTAHEAVRLCGEVAPVDRGELMQRYEELSKEGRIRFVTFHQSFSYEEFVEGLRPSTSGNEATAGGESPPSGFELKVQDGIFKRIANDAAADAGGVNAADLLDQSKPLIRLGLPQGNLRETFERFIDDAFIGWPHGGHYDWSAAEFEDWEAIKERRKRDEPDLMGNNIKIFGTWLFRSSELGSYVMLTSGWGRVHAIGQIVGDYEYDPQASDDWARHRRRVEWLWHSANGIPRETIYPNSFTTFHTAYALDKQLINWDALNRLVFGDAAVTRAAASRRPYVLIIDEINRGNVSKIFGELITLIEPDKRLGKENRLKVILPYSGHEFGVPANLHIIGTMNTADRSIALLDTALRRRFRFEEIAPEPELLGLVDGIDLAAVLTAMNRRIEYLVDRDHRIGHAFFINCKSKADIDAAMRDKVIPLLQEYFFEDWNRLAAVLGERKDKGGNFLDCEKLHDPMGEGRDPINSWRVRSSFDQSAYNRLVSQSWSSESVMEDEA